MSLSFPLFAPAYPFYEGIGVSGDVPALLPISLGGRAYMTDTPRIRRETLDVLRPALDTTGEPGQHSLNTAGVWALVGNDWRHGAGQQFFDARDSDPRMFRISKGLDPWTRERLSLLPATNRTLAAAGTPLCLVSINDEEWAVGNGVMKRSTNANAAAPTWTDVTVTGPLTLASTVHATTDGTRIYTAHGANGVGRAAKGAASIAQWSVYQATKVFYANGRLFAFKPGELVELDSTGTPSAPLWTGGLGGDGVVISVTGTPAGVFVAYNTVDRGEVLYVGLNATTGALAVPLFAGSLNKGETFNELVYYQNLVLAATSRGFRLGTIVNSGRNIEFGPALPLGPIGGAAAFGQYAWIIWNDYDATSDGLGRVDLSTWTETYVPAYASDLMVSNALGTITQVVMHQGQPHFVVAGSGIYTAHPTAKTTEASIHSGYMRLGTFERKVAVSMDLRHEALDGSIVVELCDEQLVEHEVGVSNVAGSLGPATELSTGNLVGEALEVCLTFHPDGTGTKGPVLRRWTFRGMNIGWRTDAIELPLFIRSTVNTMTGNPYNYDPHDEWLYLKSLEANRTVVTLIMGGQSESVVVDKVGIEPERWMDDHHWFEGTTIVRLLTIDQAGL